ncbi:MAG: lysophospholipid acyltransferase family protein [Acidobacteriota bacterium]
MPLEALPSPRSFSKRLTGHVYGIIATLFLFSTLLAFNLVQTLSLILLPFSRQVFRRFNRFSAGTWWGWCVQLSELFYGVRLVVSGTHIPKAENTILVVNHQQMPDITAIMALAWTKDRLGDLKWFVKDPIKYVPGVGWGMLFLDCLFVKRDWTADRSGVERTFRKFTSARIPLWLIIFAEGTRVTAEKVALARSYAMEHGLTPTDHVLVPRTKGFVAAVQNLRNHVTAVYDLTIGYETGVPTIWQYVKGYARLTHMHVRRYPIDELPHDEEELSSWLLDRFVEKDRRLAEFYQSGCFEGETPGHPCLRTLVP